MECEYTYIESERSSQRRGRFDKGRLIRTESAKLFGKFDHGQFNPGNFDPGENSDVGPQIVGFTGN